MESKKTQQNWVNVALAFTLNRSLSITRSRSLSLFCLSCRPLGTQQLSCCILRCRGRRRRRRRRRQRSSLVARINYCVLHTKGRLTPHLPQRLSKSGCYNNNKNNNRNSPPTPDSASSLSTHC